VRMCPPAYIAAHTFFLRAGETLDLESLKSQLATAGYQHVTQVVAPGEVCVRGGIIDLFPMGNTLPYRLDLDDELIDSIKTFDVDTQRTLYSVAEIRLLPARELPLGEAGRARFRSRRRRLPEGGRPKRSTCARKSIRESMSRRPRTRASARSPPRCCRRWRWPGAHRIRSRR